MIGVFVFIFVIAWFWPKKQRWRVKASYRALKTLNKMDNAAQKFAYLRKVDPFVFEEMILSAFKDSGIKIKRNKRYTGDGGIDGKIIINGSPVLIQAKRYAKHISPQHVSDFASLCRQNKAKGLFIHTGKTGAKSLSHLGQQVGIISGQKLLALLGGEASDILDVKR